MNKKTSTIARILALVALIAAVVVVFMVVSGSTGSDDDSATKNNKASKQNQANKKKTPKTYEVQPDDTLTGIAAENGVSVERIQELNPELDPQALQAGQNLKLR